MGKPFVKWVGGKRQLLDELAKHIPPSARYYEPFIGGGAAFFSFAGIRFAKGVINDANPELVNAYRVVRDNPYGYMIALDAEAAAIDWNTQEGYARVRASQPTGALECAVRFAYLNKLGFNGLYRVNRSGQFNTPFGHYANPKLYDRETILECSRLLKDHAEIRMGDFELAVQDAKPGDVIYFDPPYAPLSATANFTSYVSDVFDDEAQVRLAATYRRLVDAGVRCVLSNSDVPRVRELYEGFDVVAVQARRAINCDPTKRGPVGEVLVVGYLVSE